MKNIETWIPVVVAFVTGLTPFFIARSTNKKDLTVNDRQLLSEDERQFRADLKGIIGSYKQELEDTRNELKQSREEIKELREEIAKLHKINLVLTLENQKLVLRVEEFSVFLKKLKNNEEIDEKEFDLDD
jgi:chromosome segregation ATPase